MASTIDTRSLLIGLLLALLLLLALGAGGRQSEYRLSMAASDNWVIYGRINTLTGEVDTWTYMLHSNEIPRRPKKLD